MENNIFSFEHPLKISELIFKLQEIMREHGDVPVYSEADWEWVQNVEYCDHTDDVFGYRGDHVRLFY